MISLSISTNFPRAERALLILARDQVPYAASRALNDCARAAVEKVNGAMSSVFDRPTPFTQRAAVAPGSLAALKDRLAAIVTVRPIQAKYLLHEEIGGTRTPAEATRKPGRSLVHPGKSLPLDQYGNIPSGSLARLRREAQLKRRQPAKRGRRKPDKGIVFLRAGAPANKAGIGGYFRRLPEHKLTRLTVFEATTHYTARMGYHGRVEAAARATWPSAFRRRLSKQSRARDSGSFPRSARTAGNSRPGRGEFPTELKVLFVAVGFVITPRMAGRSRRASRA